MVFDPIVGESKDVVPLVVSCQYGEPAGVLVGPIHQRFVFVADRYSYCYLRDADELVVQFAVIP